VTRTSIPRELFSNLKTRSRTFRTVAQLEGVQGVRPRPARRPERRKNEAESAERVVRDQVMSMVWGQSRRNRRRHSRAGFGLLEVMAATGVLFISLMAAVSSQLAALNLMRTARENDTATAELGAAMETVTGQQIDSLPTSALYGDGVTIANFTDRVLRDERVVTAYPGYAPGNVPNPLTIVMTLSWTDWAGRPAQMRVATMKAR
jgi:type II secretory pathway pseudopilin PulG